MPAEGVADAASTIATGPSILYRKVECYQLEGILRVEDAPEAPGKPIG